MSTNLARKVTVNNVEGDQYLTIHHNQGRPKKSYFGTGPIFQAHQVQQITVNNVQGDQYIMNKHYQECQNCEERQTKKTWTLIKNSAKKIKKYRYLTIHVLLTHLLKIAETQGSPFFLFRKRWIPCLT
jgi:hypothetical protein